MSIKKTHRKGFNFFRSYFDVYNELSDKDKLPFIEALLNKQFLGIEPTDLKGMAKFAWVSQMHSIHSQVKGYEDKTGTKLTPTEAPTHGGADTPTEQLQGKEEVQEKGKVIVKERVYSQEIHDCLSECLVFFEKHLHPKNEKEVSNWLDTIDKLQRIEEVPREKIVEIVAKTRNNDFWVKHFMSITKLRKKNKEDIMYIVVFNEQIKSNGQQKKGVTNQEFAEVIARKFGSDSEENKL